MSKLLWGAGRLGHSDGPPQIIFAQVREDAAIELEILRSLPEHETVFCIASGGCTAMSLLLAEPAQLYAIDINPTQVYLVELKKAALLHLSYKQVMRCLLHDARSFYGSLRPHISEGAQIFWDANTVLLSRGLNNCGVIERRLRQLMMLLPLVQRPQNVRRMFRCKNLREQRRIYESGWNHWRWKLAFEVVLNTRVLGLVYGDAFIKNLPEDFAGQTKRHVDEAFLRYPLQENGHLWQLFRGTYPRSDAALPLYLQRQNHQVVQRGLLNMQVGCDDTAGWLEAQEPNSIGFFALSNILDITTADYPKRLMQAVAHAAKPGAKVCLRSIFPFQDVLLKAALPEGHVKFEFLPGKNLENRDRSFICKNLQVMRVLKS